MAEYNNGGYQPQGQQPMYNPPQYQPQAGIDPPPGYSQRIHSFYLGNTSRGLMQLLISFLTCGVGAIVMEIWGILDGIKLLDGRINTDANGVFLKD